MCVYFPHTIFLAHINYYHIFCNWTSVFALSSGHVHITLFSLVPLLETHNLNLPHPSRLLLPNTIQLTYRTLVLHLLPTVNLLIPHLLFLFKLSDQLHKLLIQPIFLKMFTSLLLGKEQLTIKLEPGLGHLSQCVSLLNDDKIAVSAVIHRH